MSETKLEDLEKTFQMLQSKMEKMNQNAIRDQKGDFAVLPENELIKILKSSINAKRKVQILNTEIGYLRCNLFSEYYERIKLAEEQNQLDEAVALMSQYAEIAIPFVSTKKASLAQRLEGFFLQKSPHEYTQHVENWKRSYEDWLKGDHADSQATDQQRKEKFSQLKIAFFKLYTYSFSLNNFPPLRYRRSDR